MYHFLSGYTAKVAGTEKGIKEPQATFSNCFGGPFMVHHPSVYAKLLGEKIEKHQVNCWLVNTGWTGGPYGTGERMKIAYTRKMLDELLAGSLIDVAYETDPVFGLRIPKSCPGIPDDVLNPRKTWTDPVAYDEQAKRLAMMFKENFKQFTDGVHEKVLAAGPRII
jgi:phosphoenolpyruvate carboxykinase (ATP)